MLNRVLAVTILLALVIDAGAASTRGAQDVWSGLVIAENVGQATPIPTELSGIEQTLKDLFGYNQFKVIGESRKTLKNGEEDWLASSKYFALKVDAQGETDTGYAVNLKLYKEQELLLETSTNLSKESPLVIKGPLVGNAQLLLVLIAEEHPQPAHATTQRRTHRPGKDFSTAWHRFRRAVRGLLP